MTNEVLLEKKREEIKNLACEYFDVHKVFTETGDPTVYEELLQDLISLSNWVETADISDEVRRELTVNIKLISSACRNSMSNESFIKEKLYSSCCAINPDIESD